MKKKTTKNRFTLDRAQLEEPKWNKMSLHTKQSTILVSDQV